MELEAHSVEKRNELHEGIVGLDGHDGILHNTAAGGVCDIQRTLVITLDDGCAKRGDAQATSVIDSARNLTSEPETKLLGTGYFWINAGYILLGFQVPVSNVAAERKTVNSTLEIASKYMSEDGWMSAALPVIASMGNRHHEGPITMRREEQTAPALNAAVEQKLIGPTPATTTTEQPTTYLSEHDWMIAASSVTTFIRPKHREKQTIPAETVATAEQKPIILPSEPITADKTTSGNDEAAWLDASTSIITSMDIGTKYCKSPASQPKMTSEVYQAGKGTVTTD